LQVTSGIGELHGNRSSKRNRHTWRPIVWIQTKLRADLLKMLFNRSLGNK
jgi:hypothetical protein